MSNITLNLVNHFVLHKQHLTDDSKIENIVQIVQDMGGLHATGSTTPYLSLFSRTRNFTRKMLDEELYLKRRLGKIRYVRKTVYVLPKENIPIAFAATRRIIEPTSEKYSKYLGITQKEYEEASKKILVVLKGKRMTTREIKKVLDTRLNISPIVNLMCDKGLLIRGNPKGGWKSNLHTYHLFSEYFPDLDLNVIDEGEARRLLVKQYLASFGPVTENDVIWWTSFPKGQIRQIMNEFENLVTSIEISGLKSTHHMLSSQRADLMTTKQQKHIIKVLPGLDPYLMGYKDRQRYLDQKYYNFIFDRSGNATSTILLNGQIIGIWDFTEDKKPSVKIFLFEDVEDDVFKEIHLIVGKIGRFMADEEVEIKECDSMVPLTQRTAGGFMSPLKSC